MFVAVLRALGNLISGFSGALLLGVNLYGFLLGIGICALFNLIITLLTNRAFAKGFLECFLGLFIFIGHLVIPILVWMLLSLVVMLICLACYILYQVCKSPWGEVVIVVAVFAFIIFMIVYALRPNKK